MRITHLTYLVSRNGGGIPPVTFALCRAQQGQGHDVDLMGVADPREAVEGATTFPAVGPLALGWAPKITGALRSRAPEVLHLHGLFTWSSHAAREYGRRSRVPVVVSPHGMLDAWALANSAWKKRLFGFLVENDNLRRSACLHALCEPEAAQLRRLGLSNPVATIPNGVELPAHGVSAEPFLGAFPRTKGRRLVLFLGRIHPKKGLPLLVDAWARVKRERPALRDWMLVVAGPDQLGHRGEVELRVSDHALASDVEFTGPLYGDLKQSALAAATAFVLPSRSEGFPVAVLEAMAAGVPVLVTRQCNLDVEACGAGLLADPTCDSVARQLSTFLDLDDAERRAMGTRGRQEVEARYTWDRVARELLEVYAYVLGNETRPASVQVTS